MRERQIFCDNVRVMEVLFCCCWLVLLMCFLTAVLKNTYLLDLRSICRSRFSFLIFGFLYLDCKLQSSPFVGSISPPEKFGEEAGGP